MCVYVCYDCYVFFSCLNVRLVHSTEQLLWCPPYGVMKSFLCEARHYRNCPTTTNGKEPLVPFGGIHRVNLTDVRMSRRTDVKRRYLGEKGQN